MSGIGYWRNRYDLVLKGRWTTFLTGQGTAKPGSIGFYYTGNPPRFLSSARRPDGIRSRTLSHALPTLSRGWVFQILVHIGRSSPESMKSTLTYTRRLSPFLAIWWLNDPWRRDPTINKMFFIVISSFCCRLFVTIAIIQDQTNVKDYNSDF